MPKHRILVLGNSEVLHIRPPRSNWQELTYTEIIKNDIPGAEVMNKAFGSSEVKNVLIEFDKYVHSYFPDIIILHFGVNEAAPRMLPRPLWFFIFADKNEPVYGPLTMSFFILLRKIFGKLTTFYSLISGGRGWVNVKDFKYVYSQLLNKIDKELKSKIIIINIGPVTEKKEKDLPGFNRKVAEFNAAINELAKERSVDLVDIYNLCNRLGVDRIRPDGVHFSPEGHKLVANEIMKNIIT
jgi:lysophospholipase L1-like esterase